MSQSSAVKPSHLVALLGLDQGKMEKRRGEREREERERDEKKERERGSSIEPRPN